MQKACPALTSLLLVDFCWSIACLEHVRDLLWNRFGKDCFNSVTWQVSLDTESYFIFFSVWPIIFQLDHMYLLLIKIWILLNFWVKFHLCNLTVTDSGWSGQQISDIPANKRNQLPQLAMKIYKLYKINYLLMSTRLMSFRDYTCCHKLDVVRLVTPFYWPFIVISTRWRLVCCKADSRPVSQIVLETGELPTIPPFTVAGMESKSVM